MLNVARLLVALWFSASAYASAAEPAELLVGNVRDTTGEPVAGAALRARDAQGRVVGSGGTSSDGTFAFAVTAPANALDVACTHCRSLNVPTTGRTNIAILVTRYAALESDVPTASDLAALPYERIVDALGLIPFVLPAAYGTEISDRGLGGGRGIVSDDGVPLVDLARGTSALAGFPDRYVRSITFTGPERAFAYGSYAAGGVFALDRLTDDDSSGSVTTGGASGIALQPRFGAVYPGYAESSDAGAFTRRADLDLRNGFAGGVLRAGVTDTAQSLEGGSSRSSDLAHASYATASRRYRTFADLTVARVLSSDAAAAAESYRSSYSEAGVRLEHPGRVTVAAGGFEKMQTAVLASNGVGPEQLSGRVTDTTAYAEATSGDSSTNATAALGVSRVAIAEGQDALASAQRWALLPSIAGRIALGKTTYARAGYSQALRVPTLLETPALQSPPTLERSALEEAALGFDTGRRVRGEAIVFRESTWDFRSRRLDGFGASVVWQVTPLVVLRAWSLHDSAVQEYPFGDARRSRQVVWLTYGNAIRADAIIHRDAANGSAPIVLDVGARIPLGRAAALRASTWTARGTRRYNLGFENR